MIKKRILLTCIFCTLLVLLSGCWNRNERSEEQTQNIVIEYDSLQNIFLALSFDTKPTDIDSAIEQYNLEYTKRDYNGTPKHTTYKIGYSDRVVLQKYSDSGDYIEISFSRENNDFLHANYFNNTKFKEAVFFNYGTHWELQSKTPKTDISGYYARKPGDKYEKYADAESALMAIYK